MTSAKKLHTISLPSWVLLPMRLFLGITFVYAGIQKLTDPQFFNPNAPGYIGRQITGFALSSPLHFFLTIIAPHAILFGYLTAYGEIAIGLGTLFGLLLRPAALFGLLLNILFFLSVTIHVYPYFYGSDIVFIFCWLTMLLNGPLNTGLPSIDKWFTDNFLQELPELSPESLQLARSIFALVLGITYTTPSLEPAMPEELPKKQSQQQRRRYSVIQQARNDRRKFIQGMLTGGAGVLGLFTVGYILSHLFSDADNLYTSTSGSSTGVTSTDSASPIAGTTGTTGTGQAGSTIAQVSAVPANSAVNFTIPSNNDPGVLVHLTNGQFVAYDALCTHAGCQVDYDPSSHLLLCPCHGAAFDPSKNAEVVNPPAQTPLPSVAIHVDSATGAITLA